MGSSIYPKNSADPRRGALVLGFALIAMTFITILLFGMGDQARVDLSIAQNHLHFVQARHAAESGLEYGLAWSRKNMPFAPAPGGKSVYPGEVFLHNYGTDSGNKFRFLTSFQLASVTELTLVGFPYLASGTALIGGPASGVRLISIGRVYEFTSFAGGNYQRSLLAEARLSRDCTLASPAVGLFASRTFRIP